jgi:hypothetical protein
MNTEFTNLDKFFERIKSISLWQRIFEWASIRKLSYDAYQEFSFLIDKLRKDNQELSDKKNENKILGEKILLLQKSDIEKQRQLEEKKMEIIALQKKYDDLNGAFLKIKGDNVKYEQTEKLRQREHEQYLNNLKEIKEELNKEREKIHLDREAEMLEKFEAMKSTWANHEVEVETVIKLLSKKHTIDYLNKEKLPLRGKPDNTIKISDEYIIFDAKSPASDDLKNFNSYIKQQTEAVRKYIKETGVKKDIYLVVPSNTVEVIDRFTYNMADYNVYVVTIDALEPIILSLKKIEEYEYLEQLSPEERENICRLIGKFAHNAKRRIQIDIFDLPKEILEKVIEFEKAEKLNPPQEKRAKQILTSELEKDAQRIRRETEAKEIILLHEKGNLIKELPLYNEDTGR